MVDLASMRGEAGDIGRWAFWVKLRGLLDPRRPDQVRALMSAWRLSALAGGVKSQMEAELRACFGDRYTEAGYRRLLNDAARVSWRTHVEELLLGRLDAETWPLYLRFEGREHLDAALAAGKGAVILFPHVGNFMLMIAAVSLSGYPYTQYAARGLAPADVAAANPDTFGHNRWRQETREAREQAEDRLPARFISLDTPIRHLYRCLEANEVVGLAFDGRIGARFAPVSWLGRTALVSPGAYRMAISTGAAIVPTLCASPDGGPSIAHFAPPIFPQGQSAEALMERYLREAAEPWVKRHPADYALWLSHCRARRAADDHPFFLDYAPDDRYKRHLGAA